MVDLINWINSHYGNLTMKVTENGFADTTYGLEDDQKIFVLKVRIQCKFNNISWTTSHFIRGSDRKSYSLIYEMTLQAFLTKIKEAIDNGSKIISYAVWSSMDNYNWASGYG